MAQRNQRGAIAAETAVVLPLLVAVAIGFAWLLALGITHMRVVDAAREAARAAARDEGRATAEQVGRRVAPDGSSFRFSEDGGLVTVSVDAPVTAPDGIFGFLPTYWVGAEATAVSESP